MTNSKRSLLAAVFFISGFSGLAYQVIWTRMAFACFGVITPVLSVVLSVYMTGLAVGAWAGGRWIEWLVKKSGRSGLFFYGVAEAIIGVGAFAAPRMLKAGAHVLLSSGQMDSSQYLLTSALALTGAILPWCLFMGTTFPFMMAYVREEAAAEADSFSFLYAANVLGAMAGCILTAIVLVETLGFAHALWVAAGGNFLIALGSILVAGKPSIAAGTISPTPTPAAKTAPPRARSRGIGWILFTTGFASMAMEVVWMRTFTPVLKTAVYSFALVVFAYLGATFAGSCLYRRNLRKGRIYSTGELLAVLVVASCLPIVVSDPRIARVVSNTDPRLSGLAGVVGAQHLFVRLESVVLLLASICPFCALLGYLTPSLIDEYSGGNPRQAGRAYGVNILGCILGPLLASYLLLPWFKEGRVLLILSAPLFALYFLNLRALPGWLRMVSGAGAFGILMWSLFFAHDFETKVRDIGKGIEVRRDYVASVIAYGNDRPSKRILVNGIGMTGLGPVTKLMVHLPLVLHRGPAHSALIICFGMGTSFRSALSWGLQTTAVDLVPSVPKEFGYFHADAAEVLRNPNGRIVIDDGRRFLERTGSSFDLITIDPPPPVMAAGSSLLYSKEFYDAAKRHLRTNGVLETWFPWGDPLDPVAIYRSLKESFPYVRCFHGMQGWGIHFVASLEPTESLTSDQAALRLPPAARNDLLEWSTTTDAAQYLGSTITGEFDPAELSRPDTRIEIDDDHPFNEYFLLRFCHLLNY
jgi:predicted membrane-bound spermidine synthase